MNKINGEIGVIHLGASSLHSSVVRQKNEIEICKDFHEINGLRSEKLYAELLEETLREIAMIISKTNELKAIVITIPMPIDFHTGRVGVAPTLKDFHGRSILNDVKDYLAKNKTVGVQVFVENDANAQALRSLKFGKLKTVKHAIFVRLSTGFGCSLISKGKIFRGGRGLAGEIGHVPIQEFGLICGCGSRGCAETLVGGKALLDWMGRVYPSKKKFRNFIAAVEACETGDEEVRERYERMGTYLGISLAAAANLLNPNLVVVSGPLVDRTGILVQSAEMEFRTRVSSGFETSLVYEEIDQYNHPLSGLAVVESRMGKSK